MSTRSRVFRSLPAAVLAAALVGMTASALAAETTVNIQATRSQAVAPQQSLTGAQSNVAQLTQRVGYADLDLTTQRGANELTTRIQQAAASVCTQLGVLYPADSFFEQSLDQRTCVSGAVEGAMVQARVAIAGEREQQTR